VIEQVPAWTRPRLERPVLQPERFFRRSGTARAPAPARRRRRASRRDLLGRILDGFVVAQPAAGATVPRGGRPAHRAAGLSARRADRRGAARQPPGL